MVDNQLTKFLKSLRFNLQAISPSPSPSPSTNTWGDPNKQKEKSIELLNWAVDTGNPKLVKENIELAEKEDIERLINSTIKNQCPRTLYRRLDILDLILERNSELSESFPLSTINKALEVGHFEQFVLLAKEAIKRGFKPEGLEDSFDKLKKDECPEGVKSIIRAGLMDKVMAQSLLLPSLLARSDASIKILVSSGADPSEGRSHELLKRFDCDVISLHFKPTDDILKILLDNYPLKELKKVNEISKDNKTFTSVARRVIKDTMKNRSKELVLDELKNQKEDYTIL